MHKLSKPILGFAAASCALAMLWTGYQSQHFQFAPSGKTNFGSGSSTSARTKPRETLLATLSSKKNVYQIGDNFDINFAIKNTGTASIALDLRDSELVIDGKATDDTLFTGLCTSHVTLAKGEETSCTMGGEWIKEPGQYELVWKSPRFVSNTLTLTVKSDHLSSLRQQTKRYEGGWHAVDRDNVNWKMLLLQTSENELTGWVMHTDKFERLLKSKRFPMETVKVTVNGNTARAQTTVHDIGNEMRGLGKGELYTRENTLFWKMLFANSDGKDAWPHNTVFYPDNERMLQADVSDTVPPVRQMRLREIEPIKLPSTDRKFQPQNFKTSSLSGWIVGTPGGALDTPLVYDGKLYFGGGERDADSFYALDASTGKHLWTYKMGMSLNEEPGHPNPGWHPGVGPASVAVGDDNCIAFTSDNRGVCVLNATTGKLVWKFPIERDFFTQPTIDEGKLYFGYLDHLKNKQDKYEFYQKLMCLDLQTGKEIWSAITSNDIDDSLVSAPVIEDGRLHISTKHGFIFSCNSLTGNERQMHRLVENDSALAAPLVVGDLAVSDGFNPEDIATAVRRPMSKHTLGWDKSPHPDALPQSWCLRAARPAYKEGRIFGIQRNIIKCTSAESGNTLWHYEVKANYIKDWFDRRHELVFTPPALGKENVYFCSADGHLVSINCTKGEIRYSRRIDRGTYSQPSLCNGKMYIGTINGDILCLDEDDADNWVTFGGNMRHNLID